MFRRHLKFCQYRNFRIWNGFPARKSPLFITNAQQFMNNKDITHDWCLCPASFPMTENTRMHALRICFPLKKSKLLTLCHLHSNLSCLFWWPKFRWRTVWKEVLRHRAESKILTSVVMGEIHECKVDTVQSRSKYCFAQRQQRFLLSLISTVCDLRYPIPEM